MNNDANMAVFVVFKLIESIAAKDIDNCEKKTQPLRPGFAGNMNRYFAGMYYAKCCTGLQVQVLFKITVHNRFRMLDIVFGRGRDQGLVIMHLPLLINQNGK